MSKSQVVTLRMPADLKRRLEQEAKNQGVSLNQWTNYLLNIQMTWMEAEHTLETRLATQSLPKLKRRVGKILDDVPDREVPDWDRAE